MKLKDVLLITNNNKGTEYKYLSSMKDYMTVLFRAFEGSETELAHAVQELCQTKENSQYAEVYLAANKTFHARFCSDEWELRNFLGGNHKMTEGEVSFDKDRCTKECLDVLTAYNMDHEGHPLIGALHYEKMEYDFRQGEVLHNLNGKDMVDALIERIEVFAKGRIHIIFRFEDEYRSLLEKRADMEQEGAN